ncbi:Tetratricopeptide (TPR) repeat [Candidatus Methanophagaceae archaeon]|nr:Tetratricopeptide (TPR) repeat [Methanophagales archaeon]
MATELSVTGKNEFEDLVHALEWSNEFAIYFAVVNPPLIRKQTAEELKISLDEKEIKVHSLELDSSHFDLLSIITQKVPSYCLRGAETEIRSVLFIFGAEEAIAADADNRRLFFDCLNWQRDKLRETIACPIVIWLPEFALRILTLEAPDFWAWRSGVYYLVPEPIWILKDTEELFKRGPSEYDSLTHQEKIKRLQQFKALLEEYEKSSFGETSESELLQIRFYLLQEAGKAAFSLANYEEAKQYSLQSLKMAERLKDKKLSGSIFSTLSLISFIQGDYASANEYGAKDLKIAQELGNDNNVAYTFQFLGLIANVQKDYHKADKFYKKSLAIREELGNKKLIASALSYLGGMTKDKNKIAKAKTLFEESLKINEEIGDKGGIADNLIELSDLAQSQGNIDEAVRRIGEAQAISNEINDRSRIANVLEKQGTLAETQGDYQQAQKYYEESLDIYELLGDKIQIASIYSKLGIIAKNSENYEDAKRYLKEGLKIVKDMGAKPLIASYQAVLGLVYLQTEDFNEAERQFLGALEIFERLGNTKMIETVNQGLEQARKGIHDKNKL